MQSNNFSFSTSSEYINFISKVIEKSSNKKALINLIAGSKNEIVTEAYQTKLTSLEKELSELLTSKNLTVQELKEDLQVLKKNIHKNEVFNKELTTLQTKLNTTKEESAKIETTPEDCKLGIQVIQKARKQLLVQLTQYFSRRGFKIIEQNFGTFRDIFPTVNNVLETEILHEVQEKGAFEKKVLTEEEEEKLLQKSIDDFNTTLRQAKGKGLEIFALDRPIDLNSGKYKEIDIYSHENTNNILIERGEHKRAIGTIDDQGQAKELITGFIFNSVINAGNGLFMAKKTQKGKYALIDSNGSALTPFIFNEYYKENHKEITIDTEYSRYINFLERGVPSYHYSNTYLIDDQGYITGLCSKKLSTRSKKCREITKRLIEGSIAGDTKLSEIIINDKLLETLEKHGLQSFGQLESQKNNILEQLELTEPKTRILQKIFDDSPNHTENREKIIDL